MDLNPASSRGNTSSRRALVTGASGGIGAACARALAEEGWNLIMVGRRSEKLNTLSEELRQSYKVEVHPLALDLSQPEGCEEQLKPLLKEYPCLGLIHAAGSTRDGLILRYPLSAFLEILTVHLTAAFLLTQLTLPAMLEQRFGRIVYMGSTAALAGNSGQSAYAAAKMGLVGLARSLAREVGRRGITINVVAPGWVETSMTQEILKKAKERILNEIPAQRVGTSEEVAALVRYLFSDAAGYIQGQTLLINGGVWMI